MEAFNRQYAMNMFRFDSIKVYKNRRQSQVQWLTPVVLATQEEDHALRLPRKKINVT
jgi:hypothetical protein